MASSIMTSVIATQFSSQRRIPVIGIAGGIGSGKSAVANWVAEHARVEVLDADHLGHEALQVPTVKAALVSRFGEGILGTDGEVDRSTLGSKVFGDDAVHRDARQELEQIIHPEIGRQIALQIESASQQNADAVLLDAAVLLEAGWRNKCDTVVFIDTPDTIRQARVSKNRGWSVEELKRRESSQWSLTEKRREADWIVSNDGNLEQAGQQLLDSLRQRGFVSNGT